MNTSPQKPKVLKVNYEGACSCGLHTDLRVELEDGILPICADCLVLFYFKLKGINESVRRAYRNGEWCLWLSPAAHAAFWELYESIEVPADWRGMLLGVSFNNISPIP